MKKRLSVPKYQAFQIADCLVSELSDRKHYEGYKYLIERLFVILISEKKIPLQVINTR